MKIAIIGAGYVGLTTAACLSERGHTVSCVDCEKDRIFDLRRCKMPIYEPDLEAIMRDGLETGRLTFLWDVETAVSDADVIVLAVGTPSGADGSVDTRAIEAAALGLVGLVKQDVIIAIKSTVPPGTNARIGRMIAKADPRLRLSVVSVPEFLREGTAVADFRHPDRIVIGSNDPQASEMIRSLLSTDSVPETPFVMTSPQNAELIKYAANAFLAMKIAFINDIADLSEAIDGDVADIARGIGLDPRIGTSFLAAGPGFGGSCFPKDTRGLVHVAASSHAPQPLIELVVKRNRERMRAMATRISEAVGPVGHGRRPKIAILGLAFKADTDDIREAPCLTIIPILQDQGLEIHAHDPQATANAARALSDVVFHSCPYEAAAGTDAVVILTEWKQFRSLDISLLAAQMLGRTIIDCRNLFDPTEPAAHDLHYVSIGRAAIGREPTVTPKALASSRRWNDWASAHEGGVARPY